MKTLDIIESTREAVHDTAGTKITIATLTREPTAREEAQLNAMGIFEWHCVSAPKKGAFDLCKEDEHHGVDDIGNGNSGTMLDVLAVRLQESRERPSSLIRSFPQTSAPVPTKTNYTFLVVAIVISFVITMVILFGGL